MLQVKSTGNGLMTLRSCGQVSAIQVRQSGEHSSCATDSVDRFSGNTETDAGHQGFRNSIEIIQVVQRQCPPSRRSKRSLRYQVLFMDEVVEMPVVMKSKDV